MTASPVLISNAGGLDVLAAVAGQLGFHPQDSVVICGLMPPRGRLGPIIRADLVSLAHPEARAAIRANLERVREVGAEGAFVARYRSQLAPSLRDDRAFDEALTLVEGLFQLVGLWDVGPGGIREHDVSTRRPVGPLFGDDDLKGTRAAAALVFQGVSTTGRREDLARIGWAAAGERRA
ncbi:MAG: DUF4192 domain-containing protein, partial [Bifidobacteriaceae bacterium]|nr:DUF4192 domain-containing protein [Bifidobacteriaceae bacterium]